MSENIFITGASSGIGLALAKTYLNRGAEVYAVSRREPESLAGKPSFHFKSLDLLGVDRIEPVLRDLLRGVTHLKLAVLNAGILGKIADLRETPLAQMQHVMKVIVWANKLLVDALYNLRIKVDQVVTISSGAAVSPKRGWNAYAISKAAVNVLTSLYAAERPETHFSAITPGIVDTGMQDQIARMPQDSRFSSLDTLRSAKGTAMMPRPEEIAEDLAAGMEKATKHPSGSFLDLSALVRRSLI